MACCFTPTCQSRNATRSGQHAGSHLAYAQPDVSISVRITANTCARAQSGVCQDKTAAASCMRDKLPVAAVQKEQPVSQDIDQSDMLRLNAGS